jgi:hypothetical protein
VSSRRKRLMRGLRRKAESLGVDVSGLTDEEIEGRLIDNSKAVASTIVEGVGSTAKAAASRIAALRKKLSGSKEDD